MTLFAAIALWSADQPSAPVYPVPLQHAGMDFSLSASKYPAPGFLRPGDAAAPAKMLPALLPSASAPPPAPPKPPADDSLMARLHGGDLEAARACIRVLGASPVDADRAEALAALAKNDCWPRYRPAYAALRKTALTEYRVDMRKQAVAMLGAARGEHRLVADALRLSALHDTDEAVRNAAFALLERHALRPAEEVSN